MQTTHTKNTVSHLDSFRKDTVGHLNSFLRGELSAVETYRQALAKVEDFTERAVLHECSRSHQERVRMLTEEVRRHGGEPATDSGPWGAFAKLVERGAAVLGRKAAIAALKQGDEHGREGYRRDLSQLDPEAREFIQSQVLPQQHRTHAAMSALKQSLS